MAHPILHPTKCIGLNHQFVNMVTPGALKRAEIDTHTHRPDASKQHVSSALWTRGAIDLQVDVVGQKIGFLHDASLKAAGAQHSQSPAVAVDNPVIVQLSVLEFRLAVRN
jgi:hypothetical protein